MNFLDKLDFLMKEGSLNKNSLSQASGIPYTTIDGWYKKGYSNAKLPTIQKLADFFDTTLDYLIRDEISDKNFGKSSNFKISHVEMEHIKKYRRLDTYGKKVIDKVLDIETERYDAYKNAPQTHDNKIIELSYYDLPVSAGTGVFLDSDNYKIIQVPYTDTTAKATYAVRVSGDSMMPKYQDGDTLLVKQQPTVEEGELGIFILNGDGYFKKFGGDRLISLNTAYDDIMLTADDTIYVKGKVIGKL